MRNKLLAIFFLGALSVACSTEKKANGDDPEKKQEIASPRKEAKGEANGVNIVVDYGSPAVKERKIWGGMEKYGKVWRAGANETTSISFDKNALINDQPLEAGKYALFIMPNENADWAVIINRDWDEWGAFSYDQAKDVLRLKVAPQWEDSVQERLEYSIENGQLIFSWERVKLMMEIKAGE